MPKEGFGDMHGRVGFQTQHLPKRLSEPRTGVSPSSPKLPWRFSHTEVNAGTVLSETYPEGELVYSSDSSLGTGLQLCLPRFLPWKVGMDNNSPHT